MTPSPVSISRALTLASERVKEDLFDKPTLNQWLVLGLMGFLSGLGDTTNVRLPGSWFGDAPDRAKAWLTELQASDMGLVVLLTSVVGVVAVSLYVLLLRMASRTDVMFAEAVARKTTAFREPWARLRAPADSIWLTRLAIQGILLVWTAASLGFWYSKYAGDFVTMLSAASLLSMVPAFLGLALLAIPILLALHLVTTLLVPLVAVRNCSATEAALILRDEVFRKHLGSLFLFYVTHIALSLASAALMALVTLLTCCLAAIPFVSSVVFLPVAYFFRAFSIAYLEETGALSAVRSA